MFSSLLVLSLAALTPLANANPFVTKPTAGVSIPAGTPYQITWQDDGKTPNLTAFGASTIGLFVGSVDVQYQVSVIGSVDVGVSSTFQWTIDPQAGPNFDGYFIRFTSVNLKDANDSRFNAESFSAKFTLTGMTGNFNTTIQAGINGSTTQSGAASTAAATSGSGSRPSGASASAASTVKPNAAASSAAGSSKNNGAGHVLVPRVLGVTGVAAIVFAFFL